MEDSTSGMKLEEKEELARVLHKKGWRLTTEEEYLIFYCRFLNLPTEEKKTLQQEMSGILFETGLGKCFMVPVDFKI